MSAQIVMSAQFADWLKFTEQLTGWAKEYKAFLVVIKVCWQADNFMADIYSAIAACL